MGNIIIYGTHRRGRPLELCVTEYKLILFGPLSVTKEYPPQCIVSLDQGHDLYNIYSCVIKRVLLQYTRV